MASNSKSPLEHVWRQFVPQGHDQALRNAFYNVAAAVFVLGGGVAAWSVSVVLQPFISALMWAVLCGSVLYPVKYQVSTSVRKWLGDIEETNSLFSLSLALLPVTCLDNVSEIIGKYVVKHMRPVIMVTVGLPLIYIIIYHTPTFLTNFIYSLLSFNYCSIQFFLDVVGYCYYLVLLLLVAYVVGVMFYLTDDNRHWLRLASVPAWLLLMALITSHCQALSVPLFVLCCCLVAAGIWRQATEQGTSGSMVSSVIEVCLADNDQTKGTKLSSIQEKDSEHSPTIEVLEGDGIQQNKNEKDQKPHLTDNESTSEQLSSHPTDLSSDVPLETVLEEEDNQKPQNKEQKKEESQSKTFNSNMYLKGVFFACLLVRLWQHRFLLSLLPIAMGYYILKKVASSHIFGEGYLRDKFIEATEGVDCVWVDSRFSVLLPAPIMGVFKLLRSWDGSLMRCLSRSTDGAVTVLLMLGGIMFLTVTAVYLAVHVHEEGMHLIILGSDLVNATVVSSPAMQQLLPDGVGDAMTSAIDNGYIYGRQWIADRVRSVLGETDGEKAQILEEQVLLLWDRVYQVIVVKQPELPFRGPAVTSAAVAVTFDSIIEGILQTPGLVSLSTLSDAIGSNFGTVMSVAESIWALLLSNLSLAASTATTAASLLLGGSLSILGAFINLIVFLSSLFYVVSVSGNSYKPVAIISGLAPAQMNSLGTAVEEAVNGVFSASFKMAAFYGMWTWLVNSLFDTKIVYIPAVVGALLGAVPLVGTYWAALPGALELAWGRSSPLAAAALVIAHVAPLACVDTAIYADIRGGGHPYLTGLAVAGGLFCWGVEGAILGPLLLCILLVATKMYTALMQAHTSPEPSMNYNKLRRCQSEFGL